jgi:hypothetical protein
MARSTSECQRIVIGRTAKGLPRTYRLQRPRSRGLHVPVAIRRIFA